MTDWNGYDVDPKPIAAKGKDDRAVFRAWDPANKRSAAIKRSSEIEMIQREAEIMKALRPHDCVVDFYGYFSRRDMGYLVMEWVEGPSLRRLIDRGGRLPPSQAVKMTVEVLRGLSAVHDSGFVHRDVNPKNIVVTSAASCRLKLIDFGIAVPKGADGYYRRSGWGFRENPFRGPERTIGVVDDRYDLYSAAVVCIFMLTGDGNPRNVTNVKVERLRHVLQRALDPNPEKRYPRANAMIEALTAVNSLE